MTNDDLVKKWQPTGLLDNIKYQSSSDLKYIRKKKQKPHKLVIAELLENCAKEMFANPDQKDFNNIALPLIRRIFDEGRDLNGLPLKATYHELFPVYQQVKRSFMLELEPEDIITCNFDLELELCARVAESYIDAVNRRIIQTFSR